MIRSILALSAAFVAIAYAQCGETTSPDINLLGTYVLVSGEKDGKAIPDERIRGGRVTFTKDRIVGTDKDNKETYVATYKLYVSKTPYTIDMVSVTPAKGDKAAGLLEKKDDTVRIIYSVRGAPAPTEFKTKMDQHLFVLKLEKK